MDSRYRNKKIGPDVSGHDFKSRRKNPANSGFEPMFSFLPGMQSNRATDPIV